MNYCTKCKQPLDKPTKEESQFSLLIFYSQATHVCRGCKLLFTIQEIKIPESMHECIIIPESLQTHEIKKKNLSIFVKNQN